jgi:hypothetical protein
MTGIVNFGTFKEIIKHWRFWVLVPTYLFYAWGVQVSSGSFGPRLPLLLVWRAG